MGWSFQIRTRRGGSFRRMLACACRDGGMISVQQGWRCLRSQNSYAGEAPWDGCRTTHIRSNYLGVYD